jgi:hypothetical protein
VQGAQRNAWNPAAKPQCSVKSLATARPRRARERIKHRVVIVSDDPRTQQAINGAPRRRRKAARARRRKTSEHGAHHVARAAPAARAGSEDGAAVRVHRRRTPSQEGGKAGTYAARLSLSRLHAMGPEEWSSVAPPLAGRQRLCIRILSLSLLAEERMRAPTPCFPFSASASASASASSPYGRWVESVICCFLMIIIV